MRLWSIHPKYVDRMGLTALWRESLLAQKVLLGKTKGYKAHPQLARFRACSDPVLAVGCYLNGVLKEAEQRGYRFDGSKIKKTGPCMKITVRKGQIAYEWGHLQKKLRTREPKKYKTNKAVIRPVSHPFFKIIPGGIENWERTESRNLSRAKPQRKAKGQKTQQDFSVDFK